MKSLSAELGIVGLLFAGIHFTFHTEIDWVLVAILVIGTVAQKLDAMHKDIKEFIASKEPEEPVVERRGRTSRAWR